MNRARPKWRLVRAETSSHKCPVRGCGAFIVFVYVQARNGVKSSVHVCPHCDGIGPVLAGVLD